MNDLIRGGGRRLGSLGVIIVVCNTDGMRGHCGVWRTEAKKNLFTKKGFPNVELSTIVNFLATPSLVLLLSSVTYGPATKCHQQG